MNFTDDDLGELSKEQLIALVKNSRKENKPNSKPKKLLSKQELFENIMISLESKYDNVEGEIIVNELVKTRRYSLVKARKCISDACRSGYLTEPKLGFFSRVNP